jgi:hypothetical protein
MPVTMSGSAGSRGEVLVEIAEGTSAPIGREALLGAAHGRPAERY